MVCKLYKMEHKPFLADKLVTQQVTNALFFKGNDA